MSVHYKFKSALEYDTVTFDGLHISVKDLKNAIMQQKRIGKGSDFDLQVTNAQTKEVYEDNDALIPKNTSLLIARIPSAQVKVKTWEGYGGNSSPDIKVDDGGPIAKTADLTKLDVSEEDKIRAMMSQSTQEYDPSNYLKIRGSNQVGAVPVNYRCFKCHQGGHWIKDCPLSQGAEPMEIKKSTGIPRSFMVPVEGPQVPGAMMTPNGSFAVPVLDHQAYNEKPQPPAPPEEKKPEIPEDLLCSICSDLLADAVMIPCCGNSFCDECIRSTLLESEEHECPDCHERDISPTTLIPNRFLRNAVANFKNTTGYVKRPVYKQTVIQQEPIKEKEIEVAPKSPVKETTPPPVAAQPDTEKLVISEADSTETSKIVAKEELDDEKPSQEVNMSEGPPGVSPKNDESPRAQPITTMANVPRGYSRHKMANERSPRRPPPHQRSPSYKDTINHVEERPGTPTVDEPGNLDNVASSTEDKGGFRPGMQGYVPPMPNVLPPVGVHQPVIGSYRPVPPITGYQGPPPNFRMPPPLANPTPYNMPGPYNVPPRPMYEGDRAPPFSNYPPGNFRPRGRDYSSRDSLRRGRTPPGIIDDPLAAFERMLKEKDERERRAKQRKNRSYSRSSSRSYSRSPVPRRGRSRTPRRRVSRSRSRSFSISRSRSRSFSPSPRGSPSRDYSPRGSPRHKGPARYRSPIKSPTRSDNYRGGFKRDFERDRDYHHPAHHHYRDRRDFGKDRDKEYGSRDLRSRIGGPPADYNHAPYYDSYDRSGRKMGQGPPGMSSAVPSIVGQWNQGPLVGVAPPRKEYPTSGHYYGSDIGQMHRYHGRDDNLPHHIPPLMQPQAVPQQMSPSRIPSSRQYDDVAPPGVEQPPVPGLESVPKYDERYPTYEGRHHEDKYEKTSQDDKTDERIKDRSEKSRDDKEDKIRERDEDYVEGRSGRRSRHSRTPDKTHESGSKSSKQRSPEKYKRKKHDEGLEKEKKSNHDKDKGRKRDTPDEKKSKEKKKRKEKRETEKKKKKEKRREHEKVRKIEEQESDNEKLLSKENSPKINYKDNQKEEATEIKERTPEASESKLEKLSDNYKKEEEPKVKTDLYGDLLSDGVDNKVIETYGKLNEDNLQDSAKALSPVKDEESETVTEKEIFEDGAKDLDDSEKDILEIHTNETDLKPDLELKNEFLAPIPEKSKWEVEDENTVLQNDTKQETKSDKSDKSAKVTNEVLKRAENAIFAKAINAIRPIEIKKISVERLKLYAGDRDAKERKVEDAEGRNLQVTIPVNYESEIRAPVSEMKPVISSKPRLSVKERLGVKVDDLDRIIQVDRNRSKSLSPFSRRAGHSDRNLGHGERRVQLDDRRRRRGTSRDQQRSRYDAKDSRRDHRDRSDRSKRDRDIISKDRDRKSHYKSRQDRREEERKKMSREREKSRHRRDPSSSGSSDRKNDKRKRDKKKEKKRDKTTKKHQKESNDKEDKSVNEKLSDKKEDVKEVVKPTERRKSTIDEASFEPDYDLETESEKEEKVKESEKAPESPSNRKRKLEKKRDSSSESSSSSSSEEEKKKKKHKKRKKKKVKRDSSSSSSSESESDSSVDDKDRKKKRHKKKQKKRKKSKK